MSLALVKHPAQVATNQPNTPELINLAANNIMAAARITDIEDLRYFNMRDLHDVRVNLHLALELLELVKKQNQ